MGVGIDMVEIARVERALERRPALAERIFTPRELEDCGGRARPGRHLAARFAAKEATLKALGLGGLRLHEVEVTGGHGSPVAVKLSGDAARVATAGGVALEVSITHSRELAGAVAVAGRDG